MEAKDLALIEQFQGQDSELKALWEQHTEYEKMLEKLEGKPYLSPTQTEEIKQLKKKKLAGKTKMQAILDRYKKNLEE